MAKPKGTKSVTKFEVVLTDPKPKKAVTRYDNKQEGMALSNVYVSNEALASLGDPVKIKVTIEAA
jgi:hypothetical protein